MFAVGKGVQVSLELGGKQPMPAMPSQPTQPLPVTGTVIALYAGGPGRGGVSEGPCVSARAAVEQPVLLFADGWPCTSLLGVPPGRAVLGPAV